jgi:hypothetical protein
MKKKIILSLTAFGMYRLKSGINVNKFGTAF